jgi:hypothetical protein
MNTQNLSNIIKHYLTLFRGEEGYFEDDEKRTKYFRENPLNNNVDEVILKISAIEHDKLDHILSSRQTMADHIVSLNIDEALAKGEPSIVDSIAHLEENGRQYFLYSFATRYCNWHRKDVYPIYGPTIHKILTYYWQAAKQSTLMDDTLYHYSHFKDLMIKFRKEMLLESLNYKELDKLMWLYGDKILSDLAL